MELNEDPKAWAESIVDNIAVEFGLDAQMEEFDDDSDDDADEEKSEPDIEAFLKQNEVDPYVDKVLKSSTRWVRIGHGALSVVKSYFEACRYAATPLVIFFDPTPPELVKQPKLD